MSASRVTRWAGSSEPPQRRSLVGEDACICIKSPSEGDKRIWVLEHPQGIPTHGALDAGRSDAIGAGE